MHAGEDLLLLLLVQVAQDVGGIVVIQLADDLRGLPRIQRGQRLRGVRLLRHLGQRLAGELGRQRLHRREALLLVQSGQHLGQVRRLDVVRPANEERHLALPHQVDHPLEQLLHDVPGRLEQLLHDVPGRSGTAGVGLERINRRSIRVGDAWMTSNSSPRTTNRSPALRNPAGPLDQQAADGGGSSRRQRAPRIAPGSLRETRCRRSRTRRPWRAGRGADLLVVLVEDLADQLLQQILQRGDAERATELVQHHGQMAPLALHVEQEIAAAPAGRRHRHRADRERISRLELEEIEGVEHADDVVQRLPEDRDPAVAAAGEDQPNLVQRRILLDGHDLGPRSHHLAHRPRAEGHDSAHHHQLVVIGHADGGTLPPDRAEIGRPGGGPGRQQQAEHPRPGTENGDDPVGHRLGPRLGQPAGNQICGEQDQGHREQRHRHNQTGRAGPGQEAGHRRTQQQDAE